MPSRLELQSCPWLDPNGWLKLQQKLREEISNTLVRVTNSKAVSEGKVTVLMVGTGAARLSVPGKTNQFRSLIQC